MNAINTQFGEFYERFSKEKDVYNYINISTNNNGNVQIAIKCCGHVALSPSPVGIAMYFSFYISNVNACSCGPTVNDNKKKLLYICDISSHPTRMLIFDLKTKCKHDSTH